MGNVLLALEALQGLLVLVQEGTTAAQRIRELLDTAHREGRDITDEELDQIQAARHDIEKSLLEKLGSAPAGSPSPPPLIPSPAPSARRSRKS